MLVVGRDFLGRDADCQQIEPLRAYAELQNLLKARKMKDNLLQGFRQVEANEFDISFLSKLAGRYKKSRSRLIDT